MEVDRTRADAIAGWAVGVGVGLIAMMLTWIVGNRLTALVWEPPTGPTVAFVGAILAGIVVALITGARLARGASRGSVDR